VAGNDHVTKLSAREEAVLRDLVARARVERQEREEEAANARIRAEFESEAAA
jgi:hypothetical protein